MELLLACSGLLRSTMSDRRATDHAAFTPATTPPWPATVERLEPGATGRWHIHTRSAIHVIDIEAGTYERVPGPDSDDFVTDGILHRFNDLTPPEVGSPMLVTFDDMDDPATKYRWHRTSRVRRIERVQGPAGYRSGYRPA